MARFDLAILRAVGWDQERNVIDIPADHPVLGWKVCQVNGCGADTGLRQGLCSTCAKQLASSGLSQEEFVPTAARRHTRRRSGTAHEQTTADDFMTAANGERTGSASAEQLRIAGVCSVVTCDRQAAERDTRLCAAHRRRWLENGRPDLGDFNAAERPVVGDRGAVILRGLSPLVAAELTLGIQLAVQQHRQERRVWFRNLADAGRVLRANSMAEIAEVRSASSLNVIRVARWILEAIDSDLATRDDEVAKDVWNLGMWGLRGRLSFIGTSGSTAGRGTPCPPIRHCWLRDAAKRWAGHRLSLGAKNAQSVRPAVRVVSQLSEWLERNDPGLTPEKLTRRHLEDFLIAQHLAARGGALAPSDHERGVGLLKKFLDDALPLGLTDPGEPLAGLRASCRLTREDLIARPGPSDPEDEVGRSLPEAIMAQLFSPACLGLLNPEQQRLLIVAAETGRRPGEICGLRFDCLEYESDGSRRLPVLVHDQPKTRRTGVRLPISETAAEAVRGQQTWVRSRYPATAQADLALFPRKSRNAHGCHPMTSSSLTGIVVAWRDHLHLHEAAIIEGKVTPLNDSAGKPVPFLEERLTPYAFRHTYAQRMIDAGVQVTVLQDLMGHRSIDTTQGYYRVRAKQKRDALDAVARYQLSLDTQLPARPVGSTRVDLGSISTPMGYCTEPANVRTFGRSCQFRHRCFGCVHFRTDVSFLADLTAYLNQLLVAREELSESHPEIAEWARRDALPSGEEIATVRGLIDGCHQLVESLEPDERSELLRHIETLREIRQHVTNAVPVQLRRSVSPPEPTVFPRLAAEQA